jgi:hypothetical protein
VLPDLSFCLLVTILILGSCLRPPARPNCSLPAPLDVFFQFLLSAVSMEKLRGENLPGSVGNPVRGLSLLLLARVVSCVELLRRQRSDLAHVTQF